MHVEEDRRPRLRARGPRPPRRRSPPRRPGSRRARGSPGRGAGARHRRPRRARSTCPSRRIRRECSPDIIGAMERAVRSGSDTATPPRWRISGSRSPTRSSRLERIAEMPPALDRGRGRATSFPASSTASTRAPSSRTGSAAARPRATAHAELVEALAQARDSTADVAGAVDDGRRGARRAAPARVARRALPRPARAAAGARAARRFRPRPSSLRALAPGAARRVRRSALVATALVIVGALLFTAGAVLAAWPLWAAGLALFGGGFVLFRP